MRLLRALPTTALLACSACSGGDPAAPAASVVPPVSAEPAVARTLDARIAAAKERVETVFGWPFPLPFEIAVFEDRPQLDARLARDFGMPATECWMVAAGVANAFVLLDPAAWKAQACEHDPDDAGHVDRLLAHEMVHVFHGQHNATGDFTGMDDLGWFCEGLAVYLSGQLEAEHAGRDREMLARGGAPKELASVWSGPYRYGVSGSLVRFVDVRFGRAKLIALLPATTQGEALAILGTTERQLLRDWEAAVTASGS